MLADDAAVALALPRIEHDLRLSGGGFAWTVAAYALALAAVIVPAGPLGDRWGRRRLLLAGLLVFAFGSLGSTLAPNLVFLIVARGLQGAGAALATPTSLAIAASALPPDRRGEALGVWAGAGASAIALGPVMGASLVAAYGWRALFAADFLLAALAMVAVARAVHEPISPTRRPFDAAGALLVSGGLTAVVVALTARNADAVNLILTLGGAGALVVFALRCLRRPYPLVEPELLRHGGVLPAHAVALLTNVVMCSLLFFLAIEFELVFGLSPLGAGAAFLPLALTLVVISPLAGRLTDRGGSRYALIGGATLLGGSQLVLALLARSASLAALTSAVAATGVALALCATGATAAALRHTPLARLGESAATLAAARMLGLAFGVALMAAIAASRWPDGLPQAGSAAIPPTVAIGLTVNAALALVAAAIAWFGLPSSRSAPSPHAQTDFT